VAAISMNPAYDRKCNIVGDICTWQEQRTYTVHTVHRHKSKCHNVMSLTNAA